MWNWTEKHDPRNRFVHSLPSGAKLLDVGCGEFKTLEKLRAQRPDLEFWAVDLLDVKGSCPEGVEFVQLDVESEKLPFSDDQFDAIFFCHVLEHLVRPRTLIQELRRTLKPNGWIYLEGPSSRSMFVPSLDFLDSRGNHKTMGDDLCFFDNFTHVRPLTKRSLRMFLEMAECRPEKVGFVRNPIKVLLSPFLIVLGLLFWRRRWLCVGVWELTGWSVYAIGRRIE